MFYAYRAVMVKFTYLKENKYTFLIKHKKNHISSKVKTDCTDVLFQVSLLRSWCSSRCLVASAIVKKHLYLQRQKIKPGHTNLRDCILSINTSLPTGMLQITSLSIHVLHVSLSLFDQLKNSVGHTSRQQNADTGKI